LGDPFDGRGRVVAIERLLLRRRVLKDTDGRYGLQLIVEFDDVSLVGAQYPDKLLGQRAAQRPRCVAVLCDRGKTTDCVRELFERRAR
jgi:hypothetical protein